MVHNPWSSAGLGSVNLIWMVSKIMLRIICANMWYTSAESAFTRTHSREQIVPVLLFKFGDPPEIAKKTMQRRNNSSSCS